MIISLLAVCSLDGDKTRIVTGIDPERFAEALERPDVKGNISQLLHRYAGRKVHWP